MAGPFPTPSVNVPGLLSDTALQEQMKLFTEQQNRVSTQGPPPAAVEMAGKIQSEYIDRPLQSAMKTAAAVLPAPIGPAAQAVTNLSNRGNSSEEIDEQQRLIDMRSDILSNDGIGGVIGRNLISGPLGLIVDKLSPVARMGALSPEEAQADAEQRLKDRQRTEAAVKADVDARTKLRNTSDERAVQLGLPIALGGFDPQTAAEQAERRAAFDAQRVEKAEKDTAAAEEQVADPSKQAKTAWWLNAAREALRGEQRVVTSALKIIPILNEARTGFEGRSDMRAWVDTVDATFDKLLPPDNPRAKDFATKLSSGFGSMAGFLALSAIGGWAGLGEKASTTIIGSAVGATSQFEDAEQHNATAFQKYISLIAGAGLGATEAIPIDRMFRRANDATGGLVTRMLVKTAAGSLEEFIQEFSQNVGADKVAQWTYDPEREVDVKGALEAGIVGGITGGMTASAISTLSEAGVIPKVESDQEGTETATQKKPDETAQQEDFLKRFFAQTQQQLDQMRDQADAVDAIVAPPVETEAQGEVAPLDPAAIAEAVKSGGTRPRTQMATDFADMLDRPALFEPSGVTGAGGTMPRTTADGNITLRHYATEARDELDPERMGSGPLVGAERARLTGPDATPRTYFGVDSGEDFVQPSVGLKEYTSVSPEEVAAAKSIGLTKAQLQAELERRWFREAQSGGYVNEGLGSISHEVTVSRNDLYNMVEDKLGLRQQLSPDLSPNERLTQYEGLVKNAGFRGAYFPRGELGQTAILFYKEKPSRVMNERYGVPANEVATPADFDAPTADTFKKAGWAVVTATREADGPFSSEANIKANNKMRQQLRRDGVQYKEVSGAYKGTPQGSNFLVFAPEDYAIKLGKQYKQESVLTRDGLVYTDGSDSLTPGRGTVVGDQARDADFFSTLPDGTSFTMDLDFDATGPRGEVLRAQQTPLPYDQSVVTIHPDDVTVLPEDVEALPGNTSGKPVESVVRAARAYAQSRGIPVRRQAEYVKADPERGKRIAAAYEAMKDEPTNPEVAAAYDAMIEETLAQYQFVKATGLTVEAIEQGQDDPYPEGPKQVLTDLENGHLWFFPTDQGFGTLTEAQAANPLLRPTDEYIGDRQLLANDVFRIVHDFFGHGIEGSGFGARGEENAWQSHMRLYTPAALPAVTSETRGQNSWVNFGPHGEANRNNQRETVYADQKAGIMPSWTWQEGVADEFPSSEFLANIAMPMDQAKVSMDGMAGYAGVMRYLTDEEKVGMRAATAQKIVDMFTSLPTPEETAAVAVAGSAKRGWYARSAKAIVDIFGVQDAPRFAALLAALSPQTSVESNAVNALRVWTAWVRAGRPTEEKRIRQLLALNVQGSGTSGSVLPAWIPNSLRALQAEDPTTVRLSGPKVDSFAKNLRGIVEEVTNDTWMANYAFIEQRVFQGSGNPVKLKSPGYKAMSALVRASAEVATEITGDTWTPAEIQETVWSWAKALYEKAGGVDAETLLMSGGLTDADIASTPDFAVLFAEGVYRRVLEEGGYGIPDNSTGSGRSSAVDGERSVLEAPEGTTLDGGTFERHLRNAARRLDALRKRRAEQEGSEDVAQREASQAEKLNVSDQDIDDFLGQYAPVRTGSLPLFPEREDQSFDRWFAGSKVVDAEGAPLAVFHGSPHEFSVFDPERVGKTSVLFSVIDTHRQGFFFAENEDFASGFAAQNGTAGKVMPVFLSIKNPLDVTESLNSSVASVREVMQRAAELDPSINNPDFATDRVGADNFWEVLDTPEGGDIFVKAAKDLGYDGLVMVEPNHETGESERVWVAFDNNQIKSAAANTGAYSPSNPNIYAQRRGGTSSSRGPLRGEQTRPRRGIPGQTQSASDEISLAKIAQNVIDQLGLTARQGRFTLKGSNVVGQFSQKQNVVRLKTWNDLSTLVHEGGHALQLAADGPLKAWINTNGSGLADLARAIYGGDTSKMKPAEKVAEGFAEFFRLYTLNRGFATQKYPTLTQSFDDLLTQHNPQLKTGLGLIGDQFAAWLQLPSAQLVRNMVTTGKQETGVNAAVKELQDKGFGNWFNEVVTQTIQSTTNRFANLNKIVSEVLNLGEQNTGASIDLKRAEDPRVLIRLAANVGNRAMIQTTDGVMAYHGVSPTTRGLRAAMLRYHGLNEDQHLQQIDPERQRDFAAYLVALRGVDEYRRLAEGKIERPPVAATLGDLKLTIKEMNSRYGADFSEAAQIVHEYGMALWQKAYDAGLMSKQTFKDGLDRQFYAPLQRDMSDRDVSTSDIAEASAAGKGRSIVKRFRGSDRDIIDPMDALMQKTFSLERVIVENDIKLSLARLADKAGKAGALVERIPAHQLLGQEYSVQEIARQLTKDDTLTETDAQDLMNILEASIEEGNRVALFRSQQAMAKGDNVLFFWENGKLAAIQLKDGDVGADVINTMNGIGRENMPVFLETVAAASTAFRTAITSWPDFLLVNFIRDQASAFILTDVGYKPFYTGLKGVGDEVRQSEWARLYNAGMGIMGGMNTAALHKARVDRDLDALRGKGYLVRAFDEKGMLGKIKGLGRVVELTETGSRLGIFRSAYERAKKDGLTDYEATIEASYLSTDYIDFGLNGNRMLMWRRLVPFLNAQLQGLYKLGRTLGGDEVRQRKGINFALRAYFKDLNKLDLSRTERQALQTGRKAWLKMMSLGFIGAALSMAFWDDPDYQDASEYLRATGWVIPIGDGRIFYIPKPFELAVFSNFVERGIEAATGDGSAPKRFMRGLAMNLTPPVAPPAIQSVIEQIANYDFFSEREIVPDYMRALAPELQYNNYTSDFAKQVGGIVGLSPMRVDHLLSGLGASAYRDLTFMYNSVLGEDRPSSDVTNWPITRRFVRDARRGSTSAADFWSYASTVSGTLRSAEVSYKNLFESGQERAAEDFLNTLDPDARAYAVLNTHFKADAKRLNPFYRARQIGTIVSAMRREMVAPVGVENSETKFSEPVKLSAEEKYKSDTLLSEYIRREMRNTLIYMQDPGWSNKTPLPTDTTLDLLSKTNPFIAEELKRRIDKANIYSAETVQEYWPEARDRLLSDREGAFLKDLVSVAKVMK